MAYLDKYGVDKYGVEYSNDRRTIVKCPNTFQGAYTIPNSVTSIGDRAFYGCSSLTNITIPNSVTSIGICAFYGCSSLTNITIPNSVTSIGICAFDRCSSLTNITIPNSVTSIGNCAFDRCSSLINITIPNSVTSIGNHAFEGCSSLTSIEIPYRDDIEEQLRNAGIDDEVIIIRRKATILNSNYQTNSSNGSQSLVKCNRCKNDYMASFKFCPYCGTPQSRTCPECGMTNLPTEALFCPECGTKL